MKKHFLAIGYKARSGKDTLAKIIQDIANPVMKTEILHWADALYEECHSARILCNTRTGKLEINDDVILLNSMLYNVVYSWLLRAPSVVHSPHGMSYSGMPEKDANLLQWWGTEYRREYCKNKNYWVDKTLEKSYSSDAELIVIADTRYPNEAEAVRALGGEVWNVVRVGGRPNTGRSDTHVSEVSMDGYKFDRCFINVNGQKALLRPIVFANLFMYLYGLGVGVGIEKIDGALQLKRG